MKRKSTFIVAATLAALAAAALWLWLTYPATLRNAYEDSWWIDTPCKPTYTAWPEFDSRRERLYAMEQMADRREWRDLQAMARRTMNDNLRSADDADRHLAAMAMRYALLAESCLGLLPHNIHLYPVQSAEDFVLFRVRSRDACVFNMYFFRELGLPDEVFHHAMEYPLAFAPCTHRALRLMTEAAAASGDSAVACKLAAVAGGGHAASLDPSRPATVQANARPMRSKAFVFGDPMVNIFVAMLNDSPRDRRLVDYAALSFILQGRKDKCRQLLRLCPVYTPETLPRVYQ